MPGNSCKRDTAYTKALAAFKRDSSENGIIADVLREHLNDIIIEPVLDVGAGSGELAALAFPGRTAFLLDLDDYPPSTNPLHHRVKGDFMEIDLSSIKSSTIIFCHSLNFMALNKQHLSQRLRQSGAQTAIVVSNENIGALNEIADRLTAAGMSCNPFHVLLPAAKLQKRIPFSIDVKCADFYTLSQHFVHILLHCELMDSTRAAVERELRRLTDTPQVQIAEAIYCYRLRN
jgi:hypothetical protein